MYILTFVQFSATGLILGWYQIYPTEQACNQERAAIVQKVQTGMQTGVPPTASVIVSCKPK